MANKTQFSHAVSVFHDRRPPEADSVLAGYAALIKTYDLQVPLPANLSAISKKHTKYEKDGWMMFTPRHAPQDTLFGHLTFALKYEGIDLTVLKALFDCIAGHEIETIVRQEPTGSYSRRIWFLYEWLLDSKLNLNDASKGNWVDVLDTSLQYAGQSRQSKRHRVRNNLPGVSAFCPTIRRTERLDNFINLKLAEKAQKIIGSIHSDILMRAASFLLLKDSKASFAIEKESPTQTRAERWGQAIGQAGIHPLSHDEFLRLQHIIITDFRFTHFGYRIEGGFIGEHERSTGMPIPDHISARYQDLDVLMDGLITTDKLLQESSMDPVLVAAIIAFGFVFIHPFEDGNGRLHRYLIHHVLAEKKFSLKNIIFPVSSVILEEMNDYRKTLESYSRPRLDFIQWKPTERGNVEVLNETIDLYRYFDATNQAEFLYHCIQQTVEKTLPDEIKYLNRHDKMKNYVKHNFEMPDRLVDLLIRFLNQENGKLSKRAKRNEFNSLTSDEVNKIEEKYADIFQE